MTPIYATALLEKGKLETKSKKSSIDFGESNLPTLKTVYILFYKSFNPLQPGVAFLYPLKRSENLKAF